MRNELLPSTFSAAGLQLELDPFEVLRLLLVAGDPIERLFLDEKQIQSVREAGQLEEWWAGVELPEDTPPERARARALVQLLLDRGVVGDNSTRADNAWRGLPPTEQAFVREVLSILIHEGCVRTFVEASGTRLSVIAESVPLLEAIAAGTAIPDTLSRLW